MTLSPLYKGVSINCKLQGNNLNHLREKIAGPSAHGVLCIRSIQNTVIQHVGGAESFVLSKEDDSSRIPQMAHCFVLLKKNT